MQQVYNHNSSLPQQTSAQSAPRTVGAVSVPLIQVTQTTHQPNPSPSGVASQPPHMVPLPPSQPPSPLLGDCHAMVQNDASLVVEPQFGTELRPSSLLPPPTRYTEPNGGIASSAEGNICVTGQGYENRLWIGSHTPQHPFPYQSQPNLAPRPMVPNLGMPLQAPSPEEEQPGYPSHSSQGRGAIATLGNQSPGYSVDENIHDESSVSMLLLGQGSGVRADPSESSVTALTRNEHSQPQITIPEIATVEASSEIAQTARASSAALLSTASSALTSPRPSSPEMVVPTINSPELYNALCVPSARLEAHTSPRDRKSPFGITRAQPQPPVASDPTSSVSDGNASISCYMPGDSPHPTYLNGENLFSDVTSAPKQGRGNQVTPSYETVVPKDDTTSETRTHNIDPRLPPTQIPVQSITPFATIAREIYFITMLKLPLLYYARVNDVIKNSGLEIDEIRDLSASVALPQFGQSYLQSGIVRRTGDGNAPSEEKFVMLMESWRGMIDELTSEWNTLNIVSAVLIPAILTLFQVDNAKDDHIVRGFTFLGLVFAICSLSYGCLLMILFRRMRSQSGLVNLASETQKHPSPLRPWTALALPAFWLIWSILTFVTAVFCFMWRARTLPLDFVPTSPRSTELVFRVVTGVVAGVNAVIFLFVAFRLNYLSRPLPRSSPSASMAQTMTYPSSTNKSRSDYPVVHAEGALPGLEYTQNTGATNPSISMEQRYSFD